MKNEPALPVRFSFALRLFFLPPLPSGLEPREEGFLIDEVENGGKRDGEQNADHTEDVSADDDGDEDEKPRHTKGVAEQARLDHIAVERLQDQREAHEDERVEGLDQQQDQAADRGADDRAEGRDQVRNADDDGYETGMKCVDHYIEKMGMPDLYFSPDANFPVVSSEKSGSGGRIVRSFASTVRLDAGQASNIAPGTAKAFVPLDTETVRRSVS